jgi:hypothetical protein
LSPVVTSWHFPGFASPLAEIGRIDQRRSATIIISVIGYERLDTNLTQRAYLRSQVRVMDTDAEEQVY